MQQQQHLNINQRRRSDRYDSPRPHSANNGNGQNLAQTGMKYIFAPVLTGDPTMKNKK